MLKSDGYSDQTSNEDRITTEKQFINLVPIAREAFELAEKELAKCEEEARQAKDGLIQCQKDAERMKENVGQAINQVKNDTKLEAEQAKLEEAFRCKTEKVKLEELMQCKIDMAKAETEWYKKVVEECKKEKGSGIDKPVTDGGGEIDTGKPVTNERGNENGEITSREVTSDCSKYENCGPYSHFYKVDNKIGSQGFSASDLLRELYPEMYDDPKIAEYIEEGANGNYGAVNYKFAFTEDLDSISWLGNIKCEKCVDGQRNLACQEEEIKSFCYPNVYTSNTEFNKSFFSRGSCPNLFRDSSETSVVKAKQAAPLILVNTLGQMIDKEGNNTKVYYDELKRYLNDDGKIKGCGNNQKCKDYIPIMEKVAWDSDKEVLLKTTFDNVQKSNPYYYDNNDLM